MWSNKNCGPIDENDLFISVSGQELYDRCFSTIVDKFARFCSFFADFKYTLKWRQNRMSSWILSGKSLKSCSYIFFQFCSNWNQRRWNEHWQYGLHLMTVFFKTIRLFRGHLMLPLSTRYMRLTHNASTLFNFEQCIYPLVYFTWPFPFSP